MSNKPKQQQTHFKRNNRIERTGLIFDKLAFVLPMKDHEDGETTINALATLKSRNGVIVRTRCHVEGFIALALCFEREGHGQKKAIVQVVASAARKYLRIEFNPSKAGKQVYEYLDMLVQNVTDDCDGLPAFCVAAHVSRLDVCYDIKGMDIHEHLLVAGRFRKSRSWADPDFLVDEETYAHGSIVFGSSGGNSLAVYDKVAQDPDAYPRERAVTRIEYRLRPQARTRYLSEFLFLENPFPRLHIFSAALACPPSASRGFMAVWRRQGFRKACELKKVSPDTRQKILKECRSAKWPWWQGEMMRKAWTQDVLDGLKACGLYELVMAAQERKKNNLDAAAQKAAE